MKFNNHEIFLVQNFSYYYSIINKTTLNIYNNFMLFDLDASIRLRYLQYEI